ncbi:unnamed protein product, partial [Callosobruchus maculatus]
QQHFWARWSVEYISELQQRTKWKRQQGTIQIGTLVVIREGPTTFLGSMVCGVYQRTSTKDKMEKATRHYPNWYPGGNSRGSSSTVTMEDWTSCTITPWLRWLSSSCNHTDIPRPSETQFCKILCPAHRAFTQCGR